MKCRHCNAELAVSFVDLGSAPPSNAYLTEDALHRPEAWYPLRVAVCGDCLLVQTADFAAFDTLFDENYAYFSSFSATWLKHAEAYVEMATARLALGLSSNVVEIAANDGYLLQYVKARNIPCLGVEPTASPAGAARKKGIEIVEAFFGTELACSLAKDGKSADLMIANNVLAHVPDINDFVSGFPVLLKPQGVATFEFPHLAQLIRHNQFDTIYHEHFSYLSLRTVSRIFERCGLRIFDVEEIPTHGGSLRVFAERADTGKRPAANAVKSVLEAEREAGLDGLTGYTGFQERAERTKDAFVRFLLETRQAGQSVAAYGAAAKGNTLLNFAGIRPDFIPFVVDRNPQKQGKFMPGSRIPIVAEDELRSARPDYIVILPWNLSDEIMDQLAYARAWGARFVTAIPEIAIK